ncbi:hypothetical protein GF413_02935, partial [Candidatus Micrarchaeota archaeon]|nr:hypothetical protein [Candidatus Micrarchaeota archaeon]
MTEPQPISMILAPEERWLPTISSVTQDYCAALDFSTSLAEKVVRCTEQVCSELVHRCREAGIREQYTLKLRYQDQACIVEIIYNKDAPLDPGLGEEDGAEVKDSEHLSDQTLWLQLIRKSADRVFFKYEGDRRALEMRIYRRSEGKEGQFWLMGLTSRLNENVKVDIIRDDKGTPISSVLHDIDSGKVLKLDEGGAFVVERLDGAHNFYDIYMEYIDKVSLTSPERLAMIFISLEDAGMLEKSGPETKKKSFLGRLSNIMNIVTFRSLNIPHGDKLVDRLYGRVSWLFRPAAVALILLFALSGFIPLSYEVTEIHQLISKPALAIHGNPFLLIELYILMTLVAVIHEFAHGLTCRHFGGSVHRIGIMFYLAMIIFFADVSAAWGFRNKWKRIAVAAAGPVLNLVVMSVCFWIWHFHKAHVTAEHSIWFLMGFFCLYSTVLNFIPFIKMDGYYMLTDLTGISTLREKSFSYLGQKLFGIFSAG